MKIIIETSKDRFLKSLKNWRRPLTTTSKNDAKIYSSKGSAKGAITKTKNAYASQWNILEID